jgi:hypothetical protein
LIDAQAERGGAARSMRNALPAREPLLIIVEDFNT